MTTITTIFSSVPLSDWIGILIALVAILLLLFLSEMAHKKWGISENFARKAVHILVGILICIFSYFFITNIPILILAVIFLFFDAWALKTHHFTSIHHESYSLGTIYYPISVFILAFLLWDYHKSIFIIATLIMVVPDALAALLGQRYAKSFFVPLKEKKSIIGTWTMFISTFLLVFIAGVGFLDKSPFESIIISVMIGLIATASELISIRGSDNLSVPLMSALFLHAFLVSTSDSSIYQLTMGITLSFIVGYLSYKLKFLQLNGAIMAFILGSIIFGFGGVVYAIPILAFFIISSLLSRIGKKRKKFLETLFAKTGQRDIYQVLANGGMAGLLVILMYLFEIDHIFVLYVITLAAATADTWATELGVFSRQKPILITNFKTVEPGTSGAVSLLGSFAALSGSALIAFIGYLVNPDIVIKTKSGLVLFIIIVFSGFFSSFIDSYLGALVQAQYRCNRCNKLTEKSKHCGEESKLMHGYRVITNDLVNILSIIITTCVAFLVIRVMF